MATMPEQKPGRSKQDYQTPREFLEAVKRRFGIVQFGFDFAADEDNTVAGEDHWCIEDDSLAQSAYEWRAVLTKDNDNWFCGGRTWGWLNPPYANIAPWAQHCMEAGQLGGRILLLVPAGVGADWYRDYVDGHAHVLALNGRLCFIEDWEHTVDPSRVKKAKAKYDPATIDAHVAETPSDFYYLSKPYYPKDTILCVYGLGVQGGFEVWDWEQP